MDEEKLNQLIDKRIKELFEQGILQITLVEKSYAYSNSISKSIEVSMNNEVLYTTDVKEKFSGI